MVRVFITFMVDITFMAGVTVILLLLLNEAE